MHNNALIINNLAIELKKRLFGQEVIKIISNSESEIYFIFSKFSFKLTFFNSQLLFQEIEPGKEPKKRIIHQFRSIENRRITDVSHVENDRQFFLHFKNRYILHIQFFGRRSSIFITKNQKIQQNFGYKLSEDFPIPKDREIVFTLNALEFKKLNPFIHKSLHTWLENNNFYNSLSTQEVLINKGLSYFGNCLYQIIRTDGKLKLGLNNTDIDGLVSEHKNIIEALTAFAKQYIYETSFKLQKEKLLSTYNRNIKKNHNSLLKVNQQLDKLNNEVSPKQKADILMANLHAIPARASSVELFDFYHNKQIVINLNKLLNGQENAEKLYQKSKKAHIEKKKLEELSINYISRTDALEKTLVKLHNAKIIRDLKLFTTEVKTDKRQKVSKPYKTITYKDCEIRVGKNAASNDELLKVSRKNWIWMHARLTAGSHVIIPLDNPDKKAIEFAASLAAYYSKAKSSALVPVIYTQRKFVRKFKGAHPGQVKVDKEKVILIEPILWKEMLR